MTEFDYKEIESYNTTERFGDRDVFRRARRRQGALDALKFSDKNEAREVAHYETVELDKKAYEDEVMGEVVTLSGDGIVVPSPRIDTNSASFHVINKELVRTENTLLAPPSITGTFYGFTPLTIPLKGGRGYKAVIGHQIALSKISQPTIYGTLMAHGPVRSTQLEFLQDRMTADTRQALEALSGVDDEKTAVLINMLDDLLGKDERFDRQTLRMVGRLVRTHLRRQTVPASDNLKDMILDLVKSKLGLYSDQPFRLISDNPVEMTSPARNQHVGESIDSILPIIGITFTPHYWWEGDEWQVDSDQDALSLIVLRESRGTKKMVSVPFEHIETLQPLVTRRATS